MASTDVQTVGGAADTAKVATAALLAVGGFWLIFCCLHKVRLRSGAA